MIEQKIFNEYFKDKFINIFSLKNNDLTNIFQQLKKKLMD